MEDAAGTFGTPEQVRLQLKSIAMKEEIDRTPGLCHTGRLVSCDNPETLGWELPSLHLGEDGIVGFRCMTPPHADIVRTWGAPRGSLHEWSALLGDPDKMRTSLVEAMGRDLPEGYRDIDVGEMHTDARLAEMQALITDSGIAPLARVSLRGDIFPSVCLGIAGADGALVAVANAARQSNRHSHLHDTAWVGLVAVLPRCRGLGLGVRVTAAATLAALERLEAKQATAFVADENAASRAMLLRVGFEDSPLRSIVVGKRFTR